MGKLISIDNGGTLTDVVVLDGDTIHHTKTLTTPYDLSKCFVEGLRKIADAIYGEPALGELLRSTDHIRYSTTHGTNALVQRKGPRLGLVVRTPRVLDELCDTPHSRDLLSLLVGDRTVTIDPTLEDAAFTQAVVHGVNHLGLSGANRVVVSFDGPDRAAAEARFKRTALRVYPRHLLGALPMLFSHELSDDVADARRTWTALFNAFLHPAMESFLYGAETILREEHARNPLLIFRNDGDSGRIAKTRAIKTYSSGPRGGMEGTRALARGYGLARVISLDVGGTTTDIGVVEDGAIRSRRWGEVEGVATSFPLSDVVSIGAGGGSVFRVEGQALTVGPDSVGALPGPACFGRGGREATITDAFLLRGVFDPHAYFGGGLTLDEDRARAAVETKVASPLGLPLDEALLAMEDALIAKIAAAITACAGVSHQSTLAAFGGAGPLCACRVAEQAGIDVVLIPGLASVFSAYGIGFSDIAHQYERAVAPPTVAHVRETLADLRGRAARDMFAEGVDLADCEVNARLSLVAQGGQHDVPLTQGGEDIRLPPDAEVATVSLRAVHRLPHAPLPGGPVPATRAANGNGSRRVLLRDLARAMIPVLNLPDLSAGAVASGPLVLENPFFTALVPEGWKFQMRTNHDVILSRHEGDLA